MTTNASHGDFRVLYANLSDKDGGAVVAQLSQMNVPYRVRRAARDPGSGGQVPDLRLKMATAGLPKGAVSGFELMDSARFGQTQFQERLTFQRGLEGELTRSITSLAAVQNARVHLALPNQNGFFREQQKPSASVLLTPASGTHARPRAGRRHRPPGLVERAGADPKSVSVLDQSGALLTGSADAPRRRPRCQQLQYVNQIESRLRQAHPRAGRADRRPRQPARDASPPTSTSRRPRRPRKSSSRTRAPTPASRSAASRRPSRAAPRRRAAERRARRGVEPAAGGRDRAAGRCVAAAARRAAVGARGGGGRREAVTNYEVDKTVRVTRNATGNVKRLNAAVVVNNRSVIDAKGKTTQVPLGGEEIEKMTALVRERIGFKQDRGDSVKVINAPFRIETIRDGAEQAVVEEPRDDRPDARRSRCRGGLALVALLVFFGLVRPAVKARAGTAGAAAARRQARRRRRRRGAAAAAARPAARPRRIEQLERRAARTQNPAAVAGIVRGWVGGSEAADARAEGTACDRRNRPRKLRHPADVARRGGSGGGVQAPVAARGARPRRDDRAHEVDAERAPRQGAGQVHAAPPASSAACSSPTPASTSARCCGRRSTRTRPTC